MISLSFVCFLPKMHMSVSDVSVVVCFAVFALITILVLPVIPYHTDII